MQLTVRIVPVWQKGADEQIAVRTPSGSDPDFHLIETTATRAKLRDKALELLQEHVCDSVEGSSLVEGPVLVAEGGTRIAHVLVRLGSAREHLDPPLDWIPATELRARLADPISRSALDTLLPDHTRPPPSKPPDPSCPRRARLSNTIAKIRREIDDRSATTRAAAAQAALARAEASLAAADAAVAGNDTGLGWAMVHAASRTLFAAMTDDELLTQATTLATEAERKLHGWRKDAVEELLAIDDEDPKPPAVPALQLARRILDEHSDNVYFKLEVLAQNIGRFKGPLWVGLLATWLAFVAAWYFGGASTTETDLLAPWRVPVYAALGALGAALTAALTTIGSSDRIPEILGSTQVSRTRPLIGAASGLALGVLAHAGLVPFVDSEFATVCATALLGGLSDTLLGLLVRRYEKKVSE